MAPNETENHDFQAEVKQLLDLMIHSLYSNTEVFLRELISNASDALDRRRFDGLTHPELIPDEPLGIALRVDPENRTLTVSDNGIGMSREEVIANIGTIAKSGTAEFAHALRDRKGSEIPPELIGQFGVGFYASFMVADHVGVLSRKAGEDSATRWESSGEGGFTIETADRPTAGTDVSLHLKPAGGDDGAIDYTDEFILRRIVRKYSDFVAYPIRLVTGDAAADGASSDPLNSMKAIWTRPADDVGEDEHHEFYKHISHDWSDPLLHVATRIEGTFEATALLYVPSQAPYDLYHREMAHRGIQLYVKRIFIMDECRELMPEYLRFVKGVVDAEDLSLNVSREMLQQDRQIEAIRKHLVKKVLEALSDLKRDDFDQYMGFYAQFGPVLKEGLLDPREKRDRILDLVLCRSSEDPSKLVPLSDLVDQLPADQETLYYATGPTLDGLTQSPHLEAFREKGIPVALFTDRVDEVWLEQSPPDYREKHWQSVGRGEIDLAGSGDAAESKETGDDADVSFSGLVTRLRVALQDHVKEVRLSQRLTTSPACLVVEAGEIAPHLAEMLREAGQDVPSAQPILEINASHPLVAKLREVVEGDAADPRVDEFAMLLFHQAQLAEGGRVKDPAAFSKRLTELMVRAL